MANKEELQRQLQAIQEQLAHCDCDESAHPFHEDEDQDEAVSVMAELRTQPGVVPMKHGTWQFLIEAKTKPAGRFSREGVKLEVRKRRDASVKMSRSFSPAFETEQAANDAIAAIGESNILAAMKTLAWG